MIQKVEQQKFRELFAELFLVCAQRARSRIVRLGIGFFEMFRCQKTRRFYSRSCSRFHIVREFYF